MALAGPRVSEYRANDVTYEGPIYSVRDLRYTPNGKATCEARMRVSKKRPDGEYDTVFFDVTAWEQAAEDLAEVANKDEVIVTGRLSVAGGYTKRDGTVVEPAICIVADKVERVGTGTSQQPVAVGAPAVNSDEVPF